MAIFIRLCIKYSNECVNMVCVVHVCIRNVFTHQLYILLKVNTVMFIELRNIKSTCFAKKNHDGTILMILLTAFALEVVSTSR